MNIGRYNTTLHVPKTTFILKALVLQAVYKSIGAYQYDLCDHIFYQVKNVLMANRANDSAIAANRFRADLHLNCTSVSDEMW